MHDMSESNGIAVTTSGASFHTVDADRVGQRLDNYLLALLGRPPKSMIYKMLRKGDVRVNKGRVKPDYRLQAGDLVRLPPFAQPVSESTEQNVLVGQGLLQLLSQSVLFENSDFMAINKPSGLAVHGGSGLKFGLIEALRQLYPEQRNIELVHRLDRDTSGVILVAKKRSALRELHRMLREGEVDKRYWALVEGSWPARRKVVNAPLKKNELRSGERVVRVAADGKEAETHFSVVRRLSGVTLVEAKPITGRTHQIRVHAQFAGHPLIGDDKYGRDEVNEQLKSVGCRRLFLHAHQLNFRWKSEALVIGAPLPSDLQMCVDSLGE